MLTKLVQCILRNSEFAKHYRQVNYVYLSDTISDTSTYTPSKHVRIIKDSYFDILQYQQSKTHTPVYITILMRSSITNS